MTRKEATAIYTRQREQLATQRVEEQKKQIARTVAASKRLDKAREAATVADRAGAIDYLRGWCESAATYMPEATPADILEAVACYLERQNAKVKRNPRLARDNEYFRSLRNLDVLARWRERENARRKI